MEDRVVITSTPTSAEGIPKWTSSMDKWLGKTMTIEKVISYISPRHYLMREDKREHSWYDEDIVGLRRTEGEEFEVADSEAISDLLFAIEV